MDELQLGRAAGAQQQEPPNGEQQQQQQQQVLQQQHLLVAADLERGSQSDGQVPLLGHRQQQQQSLQHHRQRHLHRHSRTAAAAAAAAADSYWLQLRIFSSLTLHAVNICVHSLNAVLLFKTGAVGSSLLVLALQTVSSLHLSITYAAERQPLKAAAALLGLSLFLETKAFAAGSSSSSSSASRLEEIEFVSLPLTHLPLLHVYTNMLLFGNGTHFIHEEGGTDLRTAADAFSLLNDSSSRSGSWRVAAVQRLLLLSCACCFCCCCFTVAVLVSKNLIIKGLQAANGFSALASRRPKAAAFCGLVLLFHCLDISLRMLSLGLISDSLFSPYNFLTVFFLQTFYVVIFLSASSNFLPAFLKGLFAAAVSPLPALLAADETMLRRRRVCLLLLCLRLFEFCFILSLAAVSFTPKDSPSLTIATNVGLVLLLLSMLVLLLLLHLQRHYVELVAAWQQQHHRSRRAHIGLRLLQLQRSRTSSSSSSTTTTTPQPPVVAAAADRNTAAAAAGPP